MMRRSLCVAGLIYVLYRMQFMKPVAVDSNGTMCAAILKPTSDKRIHFEIMLLILLNERDHGRYRNWNRSTKRTLRCLMITLLNPACSVKTCWIQQSDHYTSFRAYSGPIPVAVPTMVSLI